MTDSATRSAVFAGPRRTCLIAMQDLMRMERAEARGHGLFARSDGGVPAGAAIPSGKLDFPAANSDAEST